MCKNKVTYLPQQWNTLMDWQEIGRSRMDILKMAPRQIYEAYTQARKRPYLIHFAGYQKPWDVVDCDFAEYFWGMRSCRRIILKLFLNLKNGIL